MAKRRHRRVRIEGAIRIERASNPLERGRTHGRLILGTDGLFFIHGWEEQRDPRMDAPIGRLVLALGWLLASAMRALGRPMNAAWADSAREDGQRLLAEVRDLPPRQQVARLPGSFHVPLRDIARAKLRMFTGLDVITSAHGDEHRFGIPALGWDAAKAWVAAVSRRT